MLLKFSGKISLIYSQKLYLSVRGKFDYHAQPER